ncbi:MAG: 4Fe-4S dicluster domain-containing protein [Elusimicrobiota bacterium]
MKLNEKTEQQKKRKRIVVKEEVCIGCKLCEVWCTVEHSPVKDILKAYKRQKHERPLPKLKVQVQKPLTFAVQCRHCDEPDCQYSCITGALYIDEKDGTIRHDPDKCIGCWTCILACTRGAIQRDERTKRIASKCDFCPGRETPVCVEKCPNEAMVIVEE